MYEQIARYYDLLHEEIVADIGFLVKLAEETGDPILELGCGTGRIMLPLARLGHQVVGVDASQEMLSIAKDKVFEERMAVQERVALEHGDFIDVELDTQFNLAIIAYNTLMHLDPTALAFCLNKVRQHLRRGGALFIDVDNPLQVHDPGQDGLLLLDRAAFDSKLDEIVVLSVSSTGDGDRQTRDTIWIVDVSPAKGGPLKRTVARSTLHYYFAHQLSSILETAGFKLVGQYGDYDRRPYNADESQRLLLLAYAH